MIILKLLKQIKEKISFFIARRRRLKSYSAERDLKYLNPKLYEKLQDPKFRAWIETLEFEPTGGIIAGGKFVHQNYRLK